MHPTAFRLCCLLPLAGLAVAGPALPAPAAATPSVVVAEHALSYVAAQTVTGGAPLPDGLSVPAGFRLAGSAIATGTRRWGAELLLTGRPARGLRALLEVVGRVAPRGTVQCGTLPLGWVYADAPPAGLTDPDLQFTECIVDATGPTVSVVATLDYGNSSLGPSSGPPAPPVAVATAFLAVAPADGRRMPRLPTAGPDVAARNAYRVAVPTIGASVGGGFVGTPIRMLTGATAASAPMGGMATMHLVLRVTGRPANVFTAYLQQLRDRAGTAIVHQRHGRSALGRWRTARVDSGEDDRNARLAMTTSRGRTYLDIWVD
jgi:hypothetical protein